MPRAIPPRHGEGDHPQDGGGAAARAAAECPRDLRRLAVESLENVTSAMVGRAGGYEEVAARGQGRPAFGRETFLLNHEDQRMKSEAIRGCDMPSM